MVEDGHTEQNKRRLLSVLAHPDDESFGMGGTLALYAKRGVEVYLVCATRGEVGEVAPELLEGFDSVSDLRVHELRCAAGILGLKGVYFLDYRDSGMPGSENNRHPQALAAAPLDEVAAKVTHYIRKLQPQVVLTFDPIGGYRHPDHIAIQQATEKAFFAAGDPLKYPGEHPAYQPAKLYFHTIPKKFIRWAVRAMPLMGMDPSHFGQNKDVDLRVLVAEDFPVHAKIDYKEVYGLKEQASACHASQGGGGFSRANRLLGWAFRAMAGKDPFMRAYPEPGKNLRESDLFENINGVV
jgi:LmbE family N-acetylglucosaminyl deacetylase